jgi:hypothetical protein
MAGRWSDPVGREAELYQRRSRLLGIIDAAVTLLLDGPKGGNFAEKLFWRGEKRT